ncbi:MAG: 4a-hydroxytetrahydrobiopterin dehydratase [Candidatus Nanohaloarchaea archaeon]|nr:4a-hydroxytetrahydrobiopterin dehydratase [Candidatus Nanohaloarchaea archaeon]
MTDLTDKTCEPCQGGIPPMEEEEIVEYREQIDDAWDIVEDHHIKRSFDFNDFQAALEFVNQVGEIAEQEGHHPVIEFTWGEATIEIYTHKIDGLHENDFILASKIDRLWEEDWQ